MATASPGSQHIHHPLYDTWRQTWQAALDVYEGAGGFLDPQRPYLVPHPREWLDHSIDSIEGKGKVPNMSPRFPGPKLVMRRKIARYENVAATILDAVMGSLFAEAPTRTVANPKARYPIQDWWENADGRGTDLDGFLRDSWLVSAVFGHAVLLVDKDSEARETQADVRLPRVYRYTPLDLIDWLVDDDGEVVAVKLLEAAPRQDFGERAKADQIRVRTVDAEKWTLYDHKGKEIETAEHGFGRLPVTFLYGKRRTLTPVVGKAVMGDPQLYIDLYNLTSEVRELLRNQTFAILNVPIGPEGNVQREQENIGMQSGTANVLFSTMAAQYLSPQGDNVTAYHDHLDRLGRMIYRLAAVPWEGDSREAESAESRKIKRSELSASLRKYALELERVDGWLVEMVYRALYGDRWEAQRETDEISVAYPAFEPPDLEAVAARVSEAVGLELGETATKEIKKRAARVFLPNVAPETLADIDDEIDAQQVKTADERRQEMLEGAAIRMANAPQLRGVSGGRRTAPAPAEG